MTYSEMLQIVKHPIIFRRKHVYGTRTVWFKEATKTADALEAADTTKPFRIKVLIPYVVWSKELNAPVAHLLEDGELKPVREKDFPPELKEATDWYMILGEPHVFRWANRDKMTPAWLKSLPDMSNTAKALLDEP